MVAGSQGPFIVLIDELDRCLPDYAMELLNVTRHLFDVPGVVIVLGVNRSELGHRVQQVYGEKCDADTYLRRFVDLSIDLPRPESRELDGYTRGLVATAEPTRAAAFLAAAIDLLVGETRASLRDAEQILRRVAQLDSGCQPVSVVLALGDGCNARPSRGRPGRLRGILGNSTQRLRGDRHAPWRVADDLGGAVPAILHPSEGGGSALAPGRRAGTRCG